MILPPLRRVKLFLEESNAIEGVYGEKPLEQALNAWNYIIRQENLTLDNICRSHEILMEGLLEKEYVGKFRDCDVWIGGRKGINPSLVIEAISQWLEQMNNCWAASKNDLTDVTEQLHIQYEQIHPFVDGNGRTGRIFWNWCRFKNDFPLKIILEIEKFDYYKIFKNAKE